MQRRGDLRLAMMTAILVLAAGPVAGQEASQAGGMAGGACAEISDRNLPADLAGWAASPVRLEAGRGAGAAPPRLPVGVVADVALHPAAEVTLHAAPEQVRTPEAPHAGMLEIDVPAKGVWRVSASTALWIDLVGPGGRQASAAFGNLAPCTGIRKVVEFPLEPGLYVLQLSGNPGPATKVMVSPRP